jgi:hypothetical protein
MSFNREPAAYVNAFAALIALLVGLGAFGLTDTKGQALIAVVSGLTSAVLAFRVRPVVPTILSGALTSGFAALAAFDVIHLSASNVGLIVAFAEILLTAIAVRPFSTPVADPAPATHTV